MRTCSRFWTVLSGSTARTISATTSRRSCSRIGRVDEAKKIYAFIVTKEPKFSSAYLNLGNLYWAEGDIGSAWDIWSMGHEAIPEDAELSRWTRVAEDSLGAMVRAGEL